MRKTGLHDPFARDPTAIEAVKFIKKRAELETISYQDCSAAWGSAGS